MLPSLIDFGLCHLGFFHLQKDKANTNGITLIDMDADMKTLRSHQSANDEIVHHPIKHPPVKSRAVPISRFSAKMFSHCVEHGNYVQVFFFFFYLHNYASE